ncbi:MAG TPA: peptidoglycan DD-metalloendopeptidase family protein [Steroidobacteraceae bacterium]|nr:peptidoglycan DD-metalloendopeptidase family protein [Steroidobacteraceae bacterium]
MRPKIVGNSKVAHRFKAITARMAPYAAAASAALILWHAARDKPASVVSVPAPLVYPGSPAPSVSAAPLVPTQIAGPLSAQQAGVASTIEVVVGRNDTMDAIFRRMALDKSDLAAIRNLPGIRQSLDFLKPGDAIKVTHLNGGEIQELSRKVSDTQTLKVVREDSGFAAQIISNPLDTRIRTAGATIDSSLFQAAEAAAISDGVALKLANVFAWDIDFVLDIREGDRFTAVYEQIYRDGKYLRDGEVLAAEFVNGGKVYRAVRFTADDGSIGYYTPEGKPMRKAFLRAPVDFTRVSSGFNPARRHPILNLIRGHMGTDYAAPTGTPVHAAGDGRVSFRGNRGGYGNAIVLSHGSSVSTLYGHMSRFAKNVRVGTPVSQGEIIGYVGMTGLATGPHLHYEYLLNGVHMNPQTVRLPGAEPLRADSLLKFRSAAAPLLGSLAAPASEGPAAAPNPTTAANPATVASRAAAASPATAVAAANRLATSAPTGTGPNSSDSRSNTSVN